MSAIAGIYHFNDEPINLEHGRRMMKDLEKFPADDVQTWHSDKVFLGCHAQWITPESIGEKLPYYDHERKLAITADAIIDNRDELYERLQVDKRKRKEITDSELILLSYHKWGEESPKYLIGDFAFMIWDEIKQQVFGARDPSGYRTLYYFKNHSRFTFCTTIEPLLTLSYIEKQLNENYIAEFLAITGMIDTVDARMTPFKNIEQVPPFHSISIVGGKIHLNQYSTFTPKGKLKLRSNEEYVEAFQEVFQEAVNCRLRTFREIGSQLSGGLDSGAVVGFAAKELRKENKTLHTFSYFPPKDFVDFTHKKIITDERPYIKKTVEYVGGISDHYYDFEGRSSYTEIDDFIEVMEMPYKFAENSFWLRGIFDKAHEKGVGILLNGDKGNSTISWGSALNYYAILLKRFKWIQLLQELHKYSMKTGGARYRLLPYIIRNGFPFINQMGVKDRELELPMLINPEFAERTHVYSKLREFGIDNSGWLVSQNSYEQRRIVFDKLSTWNSGNTLNAKLSLRHKLWKRDPTNDIRVVRFCFSVPEDQFVQNGLDRALIRRSTEGILPDEIRLNQQVRGIQAADWLHRMIPNWNMFIEEVKELINESYVMNFFNGEVLMAALSKSEKGLRPECMSDPDYRTLLRAVIVFRLVKKYFERG
ncbi:lasso peptide isopeptide bond-forming cyclase [Bacillus sp. EB106-08-02-XG196]|uniref:lasso peptide isopeptide bond-forming cyclase n=1 Tax=Bacillus sp. EB106-08-02-XG196 TaxID=2737049 RepID=UPI0015C44293|nr:lasso peptide isopeptide bond-forming cyclase [Bacillus sp. EB106-08-02-XG196]NWQ39189.1 lasso peptide isopeptide bond-forming cyclase [Bacillus sp. EB106-08-02-XG196]